MNTKVNKQQTEKLQSNETINRLNRLYDDRMYDRLVSEYYSGSGFLNFGYWDENTNNAKEASENLMEKLLSFIPQKRGTILDVACGTGATTRHLLKYYRSSDVTGINISEKQLATCRNNLPGCTFLKMDAANLAFADESFDNVICVEAAFHFHTRERFFIESHRVLKPGGCLMLSDALISSVNKHLRNTWHEANFVTDLDEYAGMCRNTGFKDVKIIDATKECWKASFWNIVRFTHEKFLFNLINYEELNFFLDRIYRLASDLEYYVLVAAIK